MTGKDKALRRLIPALLLAVLLLCACSYSLKEEAGPGETLPSAGEERKAPEEAQQKAAQEAPAGGEGEAMRPFRIILGTDLHFISPSLTDKGPLFTRLVTYADGKATLYIDEITDAFVAEVIRQAPDLLILGGDLSFNGAAKSHEDMARKLLLVKEAGIPVLVIPGNHDISYGGAASFSGETYSLVPSPDGEAFRRIYQSLGYDQAEDFDPVSGSYTYRAGEDLLILMLDTNSACRNALPEESFSWLRDVLDKAERRGAKVIAVSHQNLYIHNQYFYQGVVIDNADRIRSLYEEGGVLLNLSGHMHMQHMMDREKVPDIATASLAVYPHHYGLITVYDGSLVYETKDLDVSAWAREAGRTEPDLLDFDNYSRNFFTLTMYRQGLARIKDLEGLTDLQKTVMARAVARVSAACFAGEPYDLKRLREAADLWKGISETGYSAYLESMAEDLAKDHRYLRIRTK